MEIKAAIKKVYGDQKYSVCCCSCGHAQGHQIIHCPKCGKKTGFKRRISAADLGVMCIESRKWNYGTMFNEISKLCEDMPFKLWREDYWKLVHSVLGWGELPNEYPFKMTIRKNKK